MICEGNVEYVSIDEETACAYADSQMQSAKEEVLREWDNDDLSEKDGVEAGFQAGFDGGYYEVEKIDISNLSEEDTVKLADGTNYEVSEIIKKLKACR